jgi:hypothetical protein
MLYIIIAQTAVYISNYFFASRGFTVSDYLYFDRSLILAGQIWRIVTFIFIPPQTNAIFMFFFMYLYYMIGQALERTWGGFYFNAYYFLGVILSIAGGFITGFSNITYLNLSLFLAFAILFPNQQFLIFFIIPVKVKYLAIIDVVFLAIAFVFTDWSGKAAILVSLLNLVIFFWDEFFPKLRDRWRFRKIRSSWKNNNRITYLDGEDN